MSVFIGSCSQLSAVVVIVVVVIIVAVVIVVAAVGIGTVRGSFVEEDDDRRM